MAASKSIAFVPQEAGDYLLRVLPAGYEEDACYFSFTVRAAVLI